MINLLASKSVAIIVWVVIIGGFFGIMWFLNKKTGKMKKEEMEKKMNCLSVGDKVTTIGGIQGVVDKVNLEDDDRYFILKTGTEENPSYIKFIFEAIYAVLTPEQEAEIARMKEEEKAKKEAEQAEAEAKIAEIEKESKEAVEDAVQDGIDEIVDEVVDETIEK